MSLYRADDADWLDIHAPNLVNLNLQACYGLKHVRLFPNEGMNVQVNLVNANIDNASLRHLHQHPRVGPDSIEINYEDDDMMGGGLPNMADLLGDHPGPDPQMMQMLMMMQQFAGGIPHAGMVDDDEEGDEESEGNIFGEHDDDEDENEYVDGVEGAVAF